jgi:mRNA interferase MazF
MFRVGLEVHVGLAHWRVEPITAFERPVMRGEVWWAEVDGVVQPVMLLSSDRGREIQAMFVVEPAGADIEGVCVELPIGRDEGLSGPGALRVAIPHQGAIPCNWLVTLSEEDLVRRAGALSVEKLEEFARMMKLAELE